MKQTDKLKLVGPQCKLQTRESCKSQSMSTFLKVPYNVGLIFEVFTTRTTTKQFLTLTLTLSLLHTCGLDVRMCQHMTLHISCCTETLQTFTANIRLHTFMSHYMIPKDTTLGEFLLTNVTCEPSTFIV